MSPPRIFYLTPDYPVPSWGIGTLYHHVQMLRERGFDARNLLPRKGLGPPAWLDIDVPIEGLDDPDLTFREDDVVVVPEVMAHEDMPRALPCRRVVFVQGSFLMLLNMPDAVDYTTLGYETAMAALPHIGDIIANHFGVEPYVVPPFIAPYFFADATELSAPRDRRLILIGKPEYLKAGYLDYDIAQKVLRRQIKRIADRGGPNWELVEPSGLSHQDFAALLRRSALMLNVNTLESFNASVPEAMAAGCIATCYEAYGGQDFLRSGVNAHVWPNNYIYPLLSQLVDLIEHYDARAEELAAMRTAAAETAGKFRQEQTADALEKMFRALIG